MPSSLVSSCSAVTNSLVPATLKSMSPNASSAPRMSVSATYWVSPSTVSEIRPIAMPATGAFSGTPALSSDIVEAQTEPIDVEPLELERLGHLADRVRELLRGRQHRHQGALGERAVADLAALGRADATGLPGASRAGSCSCACSACGSRARACRAAAPCRSMFSVATPEDLGLAALEQCRAVDPRNDVDLGRERTDVGEAAAVDADLVAQHPLAHQLLGQRPQRGADLLLTALEAARELLCGQRLDAVQLALALLLAGDGEGGGQLAADGLLDRREHVVLVVQVERVVPRRLGRVLGEVRLRLAQGADERLGGLQALRHDVLGRRGGAAADQVDGAGVASASTIMIATSSATTRPATTMSNTARAAGCAWGTPPTGRRSGRRGRRRWAR